MRHINDSPHKMLKEYDNPWRALKTPRRLYNIKAGISLKTYI